MNKGQIYGIDDDFIAKAFGFKHTKSFQSSTARDKYYKGIEAIIIKIEENDRRLLFPLFG